MQVFEDIIYNPAHPDMNRVDIYVPDTIRAAYIYFHGGGMTHGDKHTPRSTVLFEALAARGIMVFSCNYRFLPRTEQDSSSRPAPFVSAENGVSCGEVLDDCARAVRWVLSEGRRYGDFERVSIGGSSAGGYITMMLLLNKALLGAYGIDSERDIAGYIFDAGQPTTHFHLLELEGHSHLEVRVDEFAPLFYLTKPFESPETLPDVFTFIAEYDMAGRLEQNKLLLATMKNFGYPPEKTGFRLMPGYKHVKYLEDPEYHRLCAELILGEAEA